MGLQNHLPLIPSDAELVNENLAFVSKDKVLTFFDASGPIFACREDDEQAKRFAAAMLTSPELKLAQPIEIAKVIGRTRNRVHEYRKKYRQGGVEALEVQKRGPRGANKLKGIVLARAQKYLNEGKSNRKVAKMVGVSETTIRNAIKEGRLRHREKKIPVKQEQTQRAPSTPRERSDVDATCAGGVATKREVERGLAPTGKLEEAKPKFEPAQSVTKAGVLVTLPALLGQGLVEVGVKLYGELKNGYYGLTSMLLTFGFMAMLRIKSTEQLTDHAPGEFGQILGLDRSPEMKTARRKLAELAERNHALEFSGAFSERWAEQEPDAIGYLYIDGHVRPYHGRTHTLPKTHVQRRRLCMPATTDYWVNDANADPLMFVTAPANEGLLKMMDEQLLPQIRSLVGEDRRVTLIFDREGWSPKSFKKWYEQGFDVITYRKGKYRPWQRRCFKEVKVEVHGRTVRYLLAERTVRVAKGFRMREVRRLCDDGHQTSVMTTRKDLSIEQVAVRMFSRWQQENFFRYMRHEFALDHLPSNAVEEADPERSVPNPKVQQKKKQVARLKAKLTKAEQAYGQKAHDNHESERRTVRGFKISHAQLGREIKVLREKIERLETERKALPNRVPVRDVMDGEPVVQLERERKIITDTIKMLAYRAESQLANVVGPLLPYRDDEARKFMRQVFELPADLIPDYERNELTVRLHSMANPRSNRALAGLCEVLNDTQTSYPGTDLTLVYEPPLAEIAPR